MLKPVNGVLGGSKCDRRYDDEHAYWADYAEDDSLKNAKPGDPCPLCKALRGTMHVSHSNCKVEIRKTTIIGPINAVEATGNPLIDAAAILRVDGWVSGRWVCDDGKKCLAGAVRAACGILPDPELESAEFAEKYTKRKWYKDGKRKSARALVTLAMEIFDAENPEPKLKDYTDDKWNTAEERFEDAHEQWKRDRDDVRTDVDVAVETVTNFNDGILSRKGKRQAAIKLLERAGEKFNPRMALESYDY